MAEPLPVSESRIKKHVWAPTYELGIFSEREFLESTGYELRNLGYSQYEIHDWGISLLGRMDDVYRLNISLASASRIVIRLITMKAGATEQVFKGVSQFPWELWLPLNPHRCTLDVRVHMQASLVHHEGQAAKAINQGIQTRLERVLNCSPGVSKENPADTQGVYVQRVYGHFTRNTLVLSLDTSGEHLHRRGYRLNPGPAPLAEHKAGALVQLCSRVCPDPRWIVDGMAGSGTFGFEAAMKVLGIPPGRSRHFAFQNWPSYREKPFGHWSRSTLLPQHFMSYSNRDEQGSRGSGNDPGSVGVYALDISRKSREAWKQNYQGFHKLSASRLEQVQDKDFLNLDPGSLGLEGQGWLFLNPPYDYRIPGQMDTLYGSLAKCLQTRWIGGYPGGICLLLVPHKRLFPLFDGFDRCFPDFPFNHGGTKVHVLGLSF